VIDTDSEKAIVRPSLGPGVVLDAASYNQLVRIANAVERIADVVDSIKIPNWLRASAIQDRSTRKR